MGQKITQGSKESSTAFHTAFHSARCLAGERDVLPLGSILVESEPRYLWILVEGERSAALPSDQHSHSAFHD